MISVDTFEEMLEKSSVQHIEDVNKGLEFFRDMLHPSSRYHDWDKRHYAGWFHDNFVTGFKEHGWLDHHYRSNRHHFETPAGVPDDVNLLDVLEHIVDGVMAGLARSGKYRPSDISPDLLKRAFDNTVQLLLENVEMDESGSEEQME
jgi:hypothetical protein